MCVSWVKSRAAAERGSTSWEGKAECEKNMFQKKNKSFFKNTDSGTVINPPETPCSPSGTQWSWHASDMGGHGKKVDGAVWKTQSSCRADHMAAAEQEGRGVRFPLLRPQLTAIALRCDII